MPYVLGVDLGTTFTAAAVCEPGGEPRMLSLGSNAYAIPSVVFLREGGDFLAGEAAELQSSSDATRVARHFKRRLGDDTPIRVAGTAFAPEQLVVELLSWVLAETTARRGEAPTQVVLTHPANWGSFRIDLLGAAATTAGLRNPILLSEPEAAAIHYIQSERLDVGEVIGVYDLGGGTFDAVVMRRTPEGFEVEGRPVGVERLGGVDFDDAIRSFVIEAAELDGLENPDAEEIVSAAYALQASCVAAKRVLSADTVAHVRVAFPGVNKAVRVNRPEFEGRIRSRLMETLDAFETALTSAELTAGDLSRILLVGGSSRIPLVSALLSQRFGRPLAVDTDPKNTVALGAALFGSNQRRSGSPAVDLAAEKQPLQPGSSGPPTIVMRPEIEVPTEPLVVRPPMASSPPVTPPVTLPVARTAREDTSPESSALDPRTTQRITDSILPSNEPAATLRRPGIAEPPAEATAPTVPQTDPAQTDPNNTEGGHLLGVQTESGHRARIPQNPAAVDKPMTPADPNEVEAVRTDPKMLVMVGIVLLTVLLIVGFVVFNS